MIYEPTRFIDVIQCACTDTFQSAYPQCVDCFTQTNQTAFLVPDNGQYLPFHPNLVTASALGGLVPATERRAWLMSLITGELSGNMLRVEVIRRQIAHHDLRQSNTSNRSWFSSRHRGCFTSPK